MKYLVFDTETSGLPPKNNKSAYKNLKEYYREYPYIVQLSWVVFDSVANDIIDIADYIIKIPEHANISPGSLNIHNISKDICNMCGLPISIVLEKFKNACQNVDMLIGHNIKFDYNMIIAECFRNRISHKTIFCKNRKPVDKNIIDIDGDNEMLDTIFNSPIQTFIPRFCTMNGTIRYCNIWTTGNNGEKYLKRPKLIELYKILFGTTPSNLHNSLIDVLCTMRAFLMFKYDFDFMSLFDNEQHLKYSIKEKEELFGENCYSNLREAYYSMLGDIAV